ncbi:hypothetical protein BDQ12DRAFT_689286, partial [Crucibulum laeve]
MHRRKPIFHEGCACEGPRLAILQEERHQQYGTYSPGIDTITTVTAGDLRMPSNALDVLHKLSANNALDVLPSLGIVESFGSRKFNVSSRWHRNFVLIIVRASVTSCTCGFCSPKFAKIQIKARGPKSTNHPPFRGARSPIHKDKDGCQQACTNRPENSCSEGTL